jgi:ATP-dependent Lon protease
VLIPDENVKDLAEIPNNIKGSLEIKPVKWIDEVLQVALRNMPQPQPQPITVVPEVVEEKRGKRSRRQGKLHAH